MNVVINTPTGRLGSAVAEYLLKKNIDVTVISRNPSSVDKLVALGADLVQGSIDDKKVLATAMDRADTLFWVTPLAVRPDYHQWAIKTAQLAAAIAQEYHLKKIINISCMGAHCGDHTGLVSPLLDIESILRNTCDTVVTIRPGLFMENLLQHLTTIQTTHTVELPVYAEVSLPLVAVKDVAEVVTEYLLNGEITGQHIVGVQGPDILSYVAVARALTKELGRPVVYRELTMSQHRKNLIAAGTPDFLSDLINQTYQAINDGRLQPMERRSRETTTKTDLSLFIRTVLKPALGRAAAAG